MGDGSASRLGQSFKATADGGAHQHVERDRYLYPHRNVDTRPLGGLYNRAITESSITSSCGVGLTRHKG
jgi:hypothetical protein